MLPDMRCSPSCTRAVLGAELACHPDCSRYTGTMDVFYKVVRQEGLARLWGSMNASLALAVPTDSKLNSDPLLLRAELWALRDGLKLAFDLNLIDIEVEPDAMQASPLVHSPQFGHHPLSSIILRL
ncbi:hypothetical protein RHMOL_Rhmol02G0053300 [Rhododendron molle]|uniref:Uncharacterized protein n=1 Tax=Rhododendron molle TaxID=49168 RepID=A0ACC0PLK1_RHOML|nr:hypothetical protein RHMOL_Rhmol02G0053300 [Rhododendron molle]